MIKFFKVTGDTHGDFSRWDKGEYTPETAIIVLGDGGCNYYLNEKDSLTKNDASSIGCVFYFVRGNHEQRPELVEGILKQYDPEVKNYVYYQKEWPNLRYLMDGAVYQFGKYSALVIGGAYSVDKMYRLFNGWGWFEGEQLTTEELDSIKNVVAGKHFDFVLTHTCPVEWEPTDLFLSFIDQSTVDKTMEKGLSEIEKVIKYNVWLFGHYHRDRVEVPYAEMLFETTQSLDEIILRWQQYKASGRMLWYIKKSPKFMRLTGE